MNEEVEQHTHSNILQRKIEEIVSVFGKQDQGKLRELLENLVEEAKIDSFRK